MMFYLTIRNLLNYYWIDYLSDSFVLADVMEVDDDVAIAEAAVAVAVAADDAEDGVNAGAGNEGDDAANVMADWDDDAVAAVAAGEAGAVVGMDDCRLLSVVMILTETNLSR